MNSEKIVKKQARKSLNGNWVQIIAAISAVCVIFITALFFIYAAGTAFNFFDADTGELLNDLAFLMVLLCAEGVLAFAAPAFNGVLKMCSNVVLTGKTEITDLFYYFRDKGRYFRTLLLDVVLIYVYSVLVNVLDVYNYVASFTEVSLSDGLFANSAETTLTLMLLLAGVISIAVKVVVFLLFLYYPLAAYAIDDSRGIGKYMFGFVPFSFRHFGKSLKLFFSFFAWFLSCFFVVPAIYVLPYYLVSAISSTRWLIILDRNRRLI